MVLDASLLNTQHYKVRIKGKVEPSREGVAPSPTSWCTSYRKGSLRVTLDYGRQLYFTYFTEKDRFFGTTDFRQVLKKKQKTKKQNKKQKKNDALLRKCRQVFYLYLDSNYNVLNVVVHDWFLFYFRKYFSVIVLALYEDNNVIFFSYPPPSRTYPLPSTFILLLLLLLFLMIVSSLSKLSS